MGWAWPISRRRGVGFGLLWACLFKHRHTYEYLSSNLGFDGLWRTHYQLLARNGLFCSNIMTLKVFNVDSECLLICNFLGICLTLDYARIGCDDGVVIFAQTNLGNWLDYYGVIFVVGDVIIIMGSHLLCNAIKFLMGCLWLHSFVCWIKQRKWNANCKFVMMGLCAVNMTCLCW